MQSPQFIPYSTFAEYSEEEQLERASHFYQEMNRRRSVRQFSDRPVDIRIIHDCIRTAGTAPSGAHMQPWHFAVVSDPLVKKQIRQAAEKEEQAFYSGRAPEAWLEALSHIGTDDHKPYLEIAPYLVILFARNYGVNPDGSRYKHYYVSESVGIAAGMFISAIHNAGLATLTHTPSPMNFLADILDRPENERPFLLLPVGYPSRDAEVPDLKRKSLDEIASFR